MPTDLPPRRRPSPGHPPAPGGFERMVGAIFVVAFVGLITAELVRRGGPARWSVPFFLLAWGPLVAVHELGHALAARLVGWQLDHVLIGIGAPRWRFTVGGVPVAITALPFGGHVALGARTRSGLRWKSAFVYFMGPGIELIFVGALALLVGPSALLAPHPELAWIAIQATAAAALTGAIHNLIPFDTLDPFVNDLHAPRSPSDGLGILRSLTWPKARLEAWLLGRS